jgi:hypothetical protein
MMLRRKLRVLIACECSGAVREAFRRRGHDAWSCDLKEAEDGSPFHIVGDCFEIAARGCPTDGMAWDMIIWHPPCTDLSVSGNAFAAAKIADGRRAAAVAFFIRCAEWPCDMNVVENPVSVAASHYRPADQVFQPWEFGEDAAKQTCLWLRGVRPLLATHGDEDFFLRPVTAGRRTPDAGRTPPLRKSDGLRPEQTAAEPYQGSGPCAHLHRRSRGDGRAVGRRRAGRCTKGAGLWRLGGSSMNNRICRAIIRKGPNAGQQCFWACRSGSPWCQVHNPGIVVPRLEAKRDRLRAALETVEREIAAYAPEDPIENAS